MIGEVQEIIKAIPETAKEGRLSLESVFTTYLTNKKMNTEQLASALSGANSSAFEVAKCLQVAISSHAQISQQTKEHITKGLELLAPLVEKAETAEERSDIKDAILILCSSSREEAKESRAFLLKSMTFMTIALVCAIGGAAIMKDPKRFAQIFKTVSKWLK